MSDPVASQPPRRPTTRTRRGQTLVEFALLLPMLIVLLLGIVDFGRVFNAGVAIEAAARNAAEATALQRLRVPPPTDPALHLTYYQGLHRVAARTACAEAERLPVSPEQVNATDCPRLTAVLVCVHDDVDTACGQPIPGFDGAIPQACTETAPAAAPPWSALGSDDIKSKWVEVRLCYHFTTLFNLNFSLPLGWGLSLGDIYLQRTRSFVLDCHPGPVGSC